MICSFDWCKKKFYAKNLCNFHRTRLQKGRDMDAPNRNRIRPAIIENDIAKIGIWPDWKDWYAIVDKEFAYLDKHKRNNNWGYAWAKIDKKMINMQWLIIGKAPKWKYIDHINRNRLDNRKCNLRIVTPSENSVNSNISKSNNSWCKWVRYCKTNKKWISRIQYEHKIIYLGNHNTKEEAIKVRKEAEKIYHPFQSNES